MGRDWQSGIGFAAKAEVARQAGRLDEAEQIVRGGLQSEPASIAGRIVLASVLFDAGASDEAHASLEAVLAAVPGFDAELVSQRSLATQSPPPLVQEWIAASDIAVLESEKFSAESLHEEVVEEKFAALHDALSQPADGLDDRRTLGESFATGTVARLLEEQGHVDAAQEIRVVLSQKNHVATKTQDEGQASRDRVVGTLEKWLENLRGGMQ